MEEGARSRERPRPSEEDEDLRRPAMHGASNFIWWTWQMLESGSEYIRWSEDGTCIVVTNPERMATSVLPRFFRAVTVLRAGCAAHYNPVSRRY